MYNERSINISRYISLSAAIITIIFGFLVITGWILDIQVLKSIRSDYVTIKFNSALCFVLAGAVILLILPERNRYKLKWIADILSGLIFLIGSITLFEYLFNIDLFIDQLFIKDDPEALLTYAPGRMALNSAINFIIISVSLFFSGKVDEKSAYYSQLLALVAGLVGLASLLGYGYGISELYGFSNYTKISIITVILFLIIGIGIIMIRPHKGFMKTITEDAAGGYMARKILPFAIFIPIFLVWLRKPLEKIGFLDPGYDIHQFSILYISLLIILIWFIAEKINKTERSRLEAKEKLIESVEKYRTLIEVSSDAIFINYKNRVEYLNPAALKLFGAEDESQIIGKSPFSLFHPDFHQKIQERISKMIENNETVPVLHEKIIRLDSSLVDVEVTATPFAYKGDTAIQVILRDISERVESDSLLRETQQRFRATFNQAAVGIALVAPDGRWLQVNQRFCDITGYSSHELLQLTFQDVTYPDDLPADLRYVEQMLSGQISDYMMEKRYIRKDKSNIWVNLTVSLVKDEQDKPKYFISLVEDISARKNSEEEIKVINTRLQVLIEALSNLASARNIEQVRSIIATSARNLTGADGATIVFADGDQSYYAEEDAVEPLWVGRRFPLNECISGWVMLNNQHVVIPDIYADNRIPHHIYRPTFVKSLVMVPVKTAKPIAAIGNYWREWHEASENEIRLLQSLADAAGSVIDNITLYEDLEKRVEHRTRELHIVNKELESFAYTVSHDLRAPLRAISGFTKILLEDYSNNWDEEANRLFNVIRVNSEKMNQLIDDLLAFSRVGRAEMLQAKVSMKQLADQVVFEIQANNNYSNVQITIGQLPDSYGDQPLLKQVWTNLISNAFKYSSKARKPEIHIGSMEKDHQTTYFIKDNGVGFNMEYKDKLFNVFERLHNTREFEGTGVGLAIVQRIVQRHGGNVWAEGEENKGATFYFSLPHHNPVI